MPNRKDKGPGNSVFDAHAKFICKCLGRRWAISRINAALRLHPRNCPLRKDKSLWQWIDLRSKGYRGKRTHTNLGEKMKQAVTPQAAPVTRASAPHPPSVVGSQAAAALKLQERKARLSAESGSSFPIIPTDSIPVNKPTA